MLNKYLHGAHPLGLLLNTYGFKLISVALYSFFIYLLPFIRKPDLSYPVYTYVLYLILNMINASFSFINYVAIGSFNSQITDKLIGGTYLTFLSLWSGVGSIISRTTVLFLTGLFTFKYCDFNAVSTSYNSLTPNIIKTLGNYLQYNQCLDENQSNVSLKVYLRKIRKKEFRDNLILYHKCLLNLKFFNNISNFY